MRAKPELENWPWSRDSKIVLLHFYKGHGRSVIHRLRLIYGNFSTSDDLPVFT